MKSGLDQLLTLPDKLAPDAKLLTKSAEQIIEAWSMLEDVSRHSDGRTASKGLAAWLKKFGMAQDQSESDSTPRSKLEKMLMDVRIIEDEVTSIMKRVRPRIAQLTFTCMLQHLLRFHVLYVQLARVKAKANDTLHKGTELQRKVEQTVTILRGALDAALQPFNERSTEATLLSEVELALEAFAKLRRETIVSHSVSALSHP